MNENGYNYVYFTENASAGAIRYVKDKKGVTEVLDAQIVNGKKKQLRHFSHQRVLRHSTL